MTEHMSSVLPPRPPSLGPPPVSLAPRPPSLGPPPVSAQGVTLSDNLRRVASRGQVDNTRDLLAAGAGFEPDEEGRTALHLAAQEGHTDVCKVLTSHGCEVNTQDTMGYSPVLRAASQGVQETVQMLLESGCDPDLQDEHGNAAIHEACWNGFSKTAEVLVNFHCNVCLTNRAGFTALHLAAQNGHNECSRVLLYAGCDPNMKNNYGDTALHTAARYGHAGVARILISAKCLLSEQNKNGDTALHISAALKRRKIAKILVESGIDTDLLNKQGETAVDVSQRKDHPEIVIIISSFSKSKALNNPPQMNTNTNMNTININPAPRRHPEGFGVTFKDEIEMTDGPVVCPEDEPPLKPEPETKAEKPERRFFFFKKKKKEAKDKSSPVTPTTPSQPQPPGKQTPNLFNPSHHADAQKSAVHGFFSQYVPRDGVQLYRDLAGNIKQGPIGYAPVCQCGPSLKKLETSITDTRQSFHNQLDSSHAALNQRLHNLNIHVNRQANNLRSSVRDQFDQEHNRCHNRITERLQEERMERAAMLDRNNVGMKEEIESWLNDKLASYGHCLDHHHDDTALPPRNLFLDFPTMGRLVRSRSDETLSVSDYSGKHKKKDFYASRQAAMQQIRGWDVPEVDDRRQNPPVVNDDRRKERNNNVINHNMAMNKNTFVSAAEIHQPPSQYRNPNNNNTRLDPSSHTLDKALSPSTNSTTSPGTQPGVPLRSSNRPQHRLTPTANDRSDRARSHPRVSFSPEPYHHHHQQQHNHPSRSASSPPPKAVPNVSAIRQPRSQYNPHSTMVGGHISDGNDNSHYYQRHPNQTLSSHPHPHPRHPNLPEGGPPSVVDPKSVEQGDSSFVPQLNGHNTRQTTNTNSVSSEHSSGVTHDSSSQGSKQSSLRNQMKRYQDDYGIHYQRHSSKSPEPPKEVNAHLPPAYPRHMPRSRSVDNTLEDPDTIASTNHASGYVTDSVIRPSSGAMNSNRQYSSRDQHSHSPSPRGATRYRLPETSSGYNSELPYNRGHPGVYKRPPHSILKGGSAHTLNNTNDRNNYEMNSTRDISMNHGASRLAGGDRNYSQSVSMYGLNSAGKSSPVVANNSDSYSKRGMEEAIPGRLEVSSKSDPNLLSNPPGNNTPLITDCLQHDSFLSPSASPSPAYIHSSSTNKEDSTCSSNQDSGYDSRANRVDGGVRRDGGGDTSVGTPSSSFSMERSGCVTPSWSGSPYSTTADVIHQDYGKQSSSNQWNSVYSSNPHSNTTQNGISPRSRPGSEERENIAAPSSNQSNSYGRASGRNFSPFVPGDNNSHNIPPSNFTYSQPKSMEENRVVNSASSNGGMNRTQIDKSRATPSGYSTDGENRPMNAYSVRHQTVYNCNYNSGDESFRDRPSFKPPVSSPQVRNNGESVYGQKSSNYAPLPNHPSAQRYEPVRPQNSSLPPTRTTSYQQANPRTDTQYTSSFNSNSYNNNQKNRAISRSPYPPSQNTYPVDNGQASTGSQPSSSADWTDPTESKVQAHIEGWYQRKLIEAAQRLRENPVYNSPSQVTTNGYSSSSSSPHPYSQQYSSQQKTPASSQLQTQEGYRNNYNVNNNSNGRPPPPPYPAHAYQTKATHPPSYGSNRFAQHPPANTPNKKMNSNSAHYNSPLNFNSNGGNISDSERTNVGMKQDSRPAVVNGNRDTPSFSSNNVNGGDTHHLQFIRRGNGTPIRYDPIHGSDV